MRSFTDRELEVARGLANGTSRKELAARFAVGVPRIDQNAAETHPEDRGREHHPRDRDPVPPRAAAVTYIDRALGDEAGV